MYVPEEIERILLSKEELAARVKALGEELTRDYAGKNPLFICVLKGASVFFCDLIRQIECPLEIGFIRVSSYTGTVSGEISVDENGLPEVSGRDVVLVEDIVDTAKTLSALKKLFGERNPKSLKVASLLDKPSRRVVEGFKADYTGFEIEDYFVVGYGLDFSQQYRNLPYIGVYKSE